MWARVCVSERGCVLTRGDRVCEQRVWGERVCMGEKERVREQKRVCVRARECV